MEFAAIQPHVLCIVVFSFRWRVVASFLRCTTVNLVLVPVVLAWEWIKIHPSLVCDSNPNASQFKSSAGILFHDLFVFISSILILQFFDRFYLVEICVDVHVMLMLQYRPRRRSYLYNR